MPLSISPTQNDIFKALGDFLTGVLPAGVKVLQGQINRVGEPTQGDFVVMWPLRFPRLATNIDRYIDAVFTGSIAGTVMTVTSVNPTFAGKIGVGSTIFGTSVAAGTAVTSLGTGTGGVGTYNVSPSQSVGSETLAAGTGGLTQKAELVVQLDVHGPNSLGNAQVISTTFRDPYATSEFDVAGLPISPLHADDPKQVPFLNAEKQFEERWIVEAHLQVDQTVIVPQDFAQVVKANVVDVDATYPP